VYAFVSVCVRVFSCVCVQSIGLLVPFGVHNHSVIICVE
jgi:hypothetical protein